MKQTHRYIEHFEGERGEGTKKYKSVVIEKSGLCKAQPREYVNNIVVTTRGSDFWVITL